MQKLPVFSTLLASVVFTGNVQIGWAQGTKAKTPLLSPPAETSVAISEKKVAIAYSRPSIRGRKIMGGLVPYGQVWRTGANAATQLTTEADLDLNGLKVPAGKYTLFTLPGEKQWLLIVNKQTGQWGTEYNQGQDLGRVKMNAGRSDRPIETFTVTLKSNVGNRGNLEMAWENTALTVPFTVMTEPSRRTPPLSPPAETSVTIVGKKIAVAYSRPSMRGRKIMGALVPYGQVWRTGANAATQFTTEADLELNGRRVPAGKYSLYTVPGESEWLLIVNKRSGQSGMDHDYDDAQDLGRVKMEVGRSDTQIETFTITLMSESGNRGSLQMAWENTVVRVPFMVR